MEKLLTSKLIVAYSQCPRKAYLLLQECAEADEPEYARILDHRAQQNKNKYFETLKTQGVKLVPYNPKEFDPDRFPLTNVVLRVEDLEAVCDLLMPIKVSSKATSSTYHEPVIFVGTNNVTKEQKLQIAFAGYILSKTESQSSKNGRVITLDEKEHIVKISENTRNIEKILDSLRGMSTDKDPIVPSLILNKHCQYCCFRDKCRTEAVNADNLSLLDRVTPNILRKYEKKGIFTITQLSYMFRPRKRSKKSRQKQVIFSPELQALSIRTGKIYLREHLHIDRKTTEIFLDIEGIPEQRFYYLIGVLICTLDSCIYQVVSSSFRGDRVY